MHLVLASTSRYRRALMDRLDVPYLAASPCFEEHGMDDADSPESMVTRNALGKAHSLVDAHPGAVIIGSDQAAVCGTRVLGKPGTEDRAVEQLLQLAGREHRLLTAVAVVHAASSTELTDLVVHHMRIRRLTREEVRAYVARERPLDCAGAYKSEGLGIALFEYLRGDDPTAIIGLPLIALGRLLSRVGVELLAGDA